MMYAWILGLLRHRGGPMTAAGAGIALAVALLAILGIFVSQSASTMTARAISMIAPDWQVQLSGTTDPAAALASLGETVPDAKTWMVNYADIGSFTSETGGTVQTTGTGKAVGIEPGYATAFPQQIRLLTGSADGVVLAQQTAANLHAGPGDTVKIERLGQPPVDVKVSGVVEMPSADQFFQIIGASPQTVPQAPPDNVVLLPNAIWVQLFESQLESMPQTAERQIHVTFGHGGLPGDPVSAYVDATGRANNVLAKLAGEGAIANNLAARIDGVRLDALFAKVLFLFLGVPGAIVATLLTMLIVLSGAERRRRELALLQIRGASPARTIALTGVEALAVGGLGAVAGIAAAWPIARLALHLPVGLAQIPWFASAAICGVVAAFAVFLFPAFAALRRSAAVNAAQNRSIKTATPAWQRLWLDVTLLAAAALVFWQVSATGYRVVTAPEGVATATVDYKAYLAPALFWIGAALFLTRIWSGFMRTGHSVLEVLTKPVARAFSGIVSAAMSREGARITKGVMLVALAFSFAVSTAIFNTTYESQARVDATLTNGADVTVTGSARAPASTQLEKIRHVAGNAWAEPMQHRFAYIGTDLQDLYGIDPAMIDKATAMSNAYFAGGDAAAALKALQQTRDGVLVSDETVTDFQLQPGDTINLRLQSGDHAYHAVPFHFIGVVREFPTAPSDSFLVANAAYVAEKTGMAASETVLVKSDIEPASLASALRAVLGTNSGLAVSDVGEAAHRIGSSLVAIDLKGLTGLELAFALPIVAGAVGLVFALGLAERRRSFAILLALGAKPRHLGAFLWSEALIVYTAGTLAGVAIGTALAWILVRLMTHAFDPPPETLAVPWVYLCILCVVGLAAVTAAVLIQMRKPARPLSFSIRDI